MCDDSDCNVCATRDGVFFPSANKMIYELEKLKITKKVMAISCVTGNFGAPNKHCCTTGMGNKWWFKLTVYRISVTRKRGEILGKISGTEGEKRLLSCQRGRLLVNPRYVDSFIEV